MPTAEQEAHAAAMAAREGGDFDVFRAEYERGLAERHQRLERDARASSRAMDGWSRVQSQEDWLETVRQAYEALYTGSFLIQRSGPSATWTRRSWRCCWRCGGG